MFELEWPQEKLSKQLEWYQKSQKFELFQPQNKPLFDRRKAYNINIVRNTFFYLFLTFEYSDLSSEKGHKTLDAIRFFDFL